MRTYCMSYTHHNFHTPNCESLADDLNTKRAVVSGRVVLLSRSTETQAWFWRFVPSRNNPPRQTPRLPFLSPSDSSSTTHTHTPSIGAARLALRSNVATVLRIPQHRTTIRRRTVSSRVFASHTRTTNTHAHALACLEPCTVLDFALVRDDALSLPLCAVRMAGSCPCTCAGPCVLALPLRYLWTCIFAYALGRAASHTNTPALANQPQRSRRLSLLVLSCVVDTFDSHSPSSHVACQPSRSRSPLRRSLPPWALSTLSNPSPLAPLPLTSRLSRLVPTVSILVPPRLFASLLVPSRALSCLFASLPVCPLVRSLAN